jgi:predicted  nucleic acid-binding Zn-ribbon protein
VGERHTNFQTIRLVNTSEDQLILMLKGANASASTLAALQPIFDAHHAVQALDEQIRTRQAEIGNITKDQERLREDMKALKGSPEEKALLTRYTGELNAQEDRLAALNKEIAGLEAQRATAQADYDAKLNGLTLEESV